MMKQQALTCEFPDVSRDESFPSVGDPRPLRVAARHTTDAVILEMAGEFDNTAVAEFEAAANASIEQLRGRPLVVDLDGLDFLGSVGVAALAELHHRLGDQVRVVALATRRIRRPIKISGLHHALRLYQTVAQASRPDG